MATQATSGGLTPMAVWVERAGGSIVRGRAETVSPRGARVLLDGRPEFGADEAVLLRICFSPERPTVAASAHVLWARPLGDTVECGLEWDLGTVEFGSCSA